MLRLKIRNLVPTYQSPSLQPLHDAQIPSQIHFLEHQSICGVMTRTLTSPAVEALFQVG